MAPGTAGWAGSELHRYITSDPDVAGSWPGVGCGSHQTGGGVMTGVTDEEVV